MKRYGLLFLSLFFALRGNSQTTYLPIGSDDYRLLDRLETISGRLSDSLCLSDKPQPRKQAIAYLEQVQLNDSASRYLSNIDRFNLAQMISENGEWTADGDGAINSKRAWFNTFYKKQYNFVYVKTKDFFMVINPVLSGQVVTEQGNQDLLYINSRGAEARGWISKKIGFYTSCTSNNEIPPSFIASYIQSRRAVPGADYYVNKTGNYNYLQANGYFDFAIVKDHLNATFGFGKQFVGDGLTSLFLSDFSANYPYLKLSTHIWKFNYQNRFVKLTPQIKNRNGLLPHKYAAMHQLSLNATRWLNMGFFESVVFSRTDQFDISYMNPVIFYRTVEQANGSPDNELIGYFFKAIAAKHLQFYGQVFLDEFKPNELLRNRGFWANKWGLQLGGKYFNAFSIRNLDLQGEINVVRPYMYSHSDTIANYTHYNQPLANPLGSGFEQVIAVARYQPVKNLTVSTKGTYYIKGADTGNANFGNSIFYNYATRASNYDVAVINGIKTTCALMTLDVAYQLRRNLFLDLGATHRVFTADHNGPTSSSTGLSGGDYSKTYVYFGIRLNANKRDYDFF